MQRYNNAIPLSLVPEWIDEVRKIDVQFFHSNKESVFLQHNNEVPQLLEFLSNLPIFKDTV